MRGHEEGGSECLRLAVAAPEGASMQVCRPRTREDMRLAHDPAAAP